MKKYSNTLILTFLFVLSLTIISCGDDEPTKPTPVVVDKAPVLTSVTPSTAKVGDIIKLYGENFGDERGNSYVMLNDLKIGADDYSLWQDSLIMMKIPQGAASGFMKVVIGDSISNKLPFNIGTSSGNPFISTVRPDKGSPGEQIEILGADFGNSQGQSIVNFLGGQLESGNFVSWTNSKITFKVPENAQPGSGKLSVAVGTKTSNEVNFTVKQSETPIDPPVITKIEPEKGVEGDTIKIYGTDFTDFRDVNQGFVHIGGVKVDDDRGFVDWKDELILVIIPEGAATGKLYVSKSGVKSNEVDFTYGKYETPDPVITSVSNKLLQINQMMSIYGKNFGPSQGMSSVKLGDNKLSRTKIIEWTDIEITIQIPIDMTPGDYPIVVTVNDVESNSYGITIIDNNPNKKLVEMLEISKGTFNMGTPSDDMWASPQREVTLSSDFYMSKYEITQLVWKKVSSTFPDYLNEDVGDDKPATQLTWFAIVQWCNDASKKDGYDECYTINGENVICDFTKNGYRLPTEAEWEYACRAGTAGDLHFSGSIADYAWYHGNSGMHLNEVGQKEANAWGLYDMYGNASEWVWDWLESWSSSPVTDPTGPSEFEGNGKVVRGGSNVTVESEINSWYRTDVHPTILDRRIGFRVVRTK